MIADPWPDEVAATLAQAHGTTCRVELELPGYLEPVRLDATRVDLVFDETSAPRVRGTVAARIPDDLAILLACDPRLGVRCLVHVGYRLRNGTTDEQLVANLGVRVRDVVREGEGGGDQLLLTLASDEALIMDDQTLNYWGEYGQPAVEVLEGALLNGVNTGGTGYFPTVVVDPSIAANPLTLTGEEGLTTWDTIESLADALKADVYDDGSRTFYVVPRVRVTGVSRAQLRTGPGGTITRSRSRMTRELWANLVRLNFNDGYGQAQQLTGPYAAYGPAGVRGLVIDRPVRSHHSGGAQPQADASLAAYLSRGRSLNLEAIAAWWLRPGMTVTAQLPTGAQERHITARVALAWPSDTMTLDLRLADGAAEPTGE